MLYNIDENLLNKAETLKLKFSTKPLPTSHEARMAIYSAPISFLTYRATPQKMCLEGFILKFGLTISQQKKLKDLCNFNLRVQEFKIGYLVDILGLTESQISSIYSY